MGFNSVKTFGQIPVDTSLNNVRTRKLLFLFILLRASIDKAKPFDETV